MVIGTRFGAVTVLLGALVLPAWAQDKPGGTWTDPPVRGSAAPQTPEQSERSATGSESPASGRAQEKSASTPEADRPSITKDGATRQSAASAAATRRAARLRREHVRRFAARSRAVAEARDARRRASPRARIARSDRAAGRYALRTPRYGGATRFAWRYEQPAYDEDADAGPYYGRGYARRTAGWGGLLGGRARQIAEARAAGYIVMRSRTYEYPDGTQIRRFRPLEYEDLD